MVITVQDTGNEHIKALLSELRRTQEALAAKQQDLLRAITIDDSSADGLRQEVGALSAAVMTILGRMEDALHRRSSRPHWAGSTAVAKPRRNGPSGPLRQ